MKTKQPIDIKTLFEKALGNTINDFTLPPPVFTAMQGEVIEDCVIYEIDFAALYASNLKWMTLARNISDTQLITVVQRTQMMQRLTAKEKYELLKVIAPIYEEVLPNYQFATVLGITPQSLSRIKREI